MRLCFTSTDDNATVEHSAKNVQLIAVEVQLSFAVSFLQTLDVKRE